MKQIKLAFYLITDEWGRRRRSPCLLSEEEAHARYKDPTVIEHTVVTVDSPETPEDLDRMSTSAWQKNAKKPPNPP